jgi:hypothetical protein
LTDPTNLPRLYGEKEIGKILKRATELQHEEPSAPSAGSMSLQELEDIAAEAGIDPTFLRRAALEIDTGAMELSTWGKFLGEELLLVREVTIEGELRDDAFERIVEVIQRGTSEHGQPSLLGRTLTWRAETPNKSRTIQITVSSRDGQTTLRLEENLTQFAVGLFAGTTAGVGGGVGVGFGVGFGLNVLGSALFATLFPVGVVGLSYIGSRAIYRAIVKRRRSAMGGLFEQVFNEVKACLVDLALPPGDPPD